MTITTLAQLTDDITEVRDATGFTWDREPGTDVWHSGVPGIGPVASVQLVDVLGPLTPTVAYHI